MCQSGIADLRGAEDQFFEVGQLFKMRQPRVPNFGAVKFQFSEVGQLFKMRQPRIGDLRLSKLQNLELRQPVEMCQPVIGNCSVMTLGWPEGSKIGARRMTTRTTMKHSVKSLATIVAVGIIKVSMKTGPLWMR